MVLNKIKLKKNKLPGGDMTPIPPPVNTPLARYWVNEFKR